MSTPDPDKTSSSNPLNGLDKKALLASGLSSSDTEDSPPEIPGYEVIEKIGHGGMGTVYLAQQLSLNRPVAVKVLSLIASATDSEKELLLSRLESEALVMAKLNHPNLVAVHDFVKLDTGEAVIVMEFVSGGNVRERFFTGNTEPVAIETIITIGKQVSSCLEAAHSVGLVHRDIKPENLLIDEAGKFKVSDFGLAIDQEALRLTVSGMSVGTLGYSAPEQLDGLETDHRADIYSLGVVLYELATGRKPMGDVQRPSQLRSDFPQWLEQLIVASLQADRDLRIQSAAEFHHRIGNRSELGDGKNGTSTRSRRWWLASAVVPVFSGLLFGGWRWFASERDGVSEIVPTKITTRLVAVRGNWRRDGADYLSTRGIGILGITKADSVMGMTVRLDFTRTEGVTPIALFFRHPNGFGTALLDAYRNGLGGVEVIDGETLVTSLDTFRFTIENGRRYRWEVDLRPKDIVMRVDDVVMLELPLSDEPLEIAEDWNWQDTEVEDYSLLLGTFNNLTKIHGVEVFPITSA